MHKMQKKEKILTVMLLGPTATGKSETAKSLAKILTGIYGTEYGCIEVAGSEFASSHTVNRFFGAPPGYVGHGQPTVLDPVRQNPYQIIVIDEIEKSDPKVVEGLMEAIDTGKLGMADNSPAIDLSRCILIFTSNLPIPMDKYRAAGDFERTEICRDAFTKYCHRPEISGKIANYIVYQELSPEANARIVIKFIRQELANYDIKLRSIDPALLNEFLDFNTAYGARTRAGNVRASVGRAAAAPATEPPAGGSGREVGSPQRFTAQDPVRSCLRERRIPCVTSSLQTLKPVLPRCAALRAALPTV